MKNFIFRFCSNLFYEKFVFEVKNEPDHLREFSIKEIQRNIIKSPV